MVWTVLVVLLSGSGCSSSKPLQKPVKLIDLFREVITGDFDNSKQVAAEISAGRQLHPSARHVNRVADAKIDNLPADLNGFFVLEESYYEYPGKPADIKPYLFFFSAETDTSIRLIVYQLPADPDKKMIRNDNAALRLDYALLKPSPTFKGARYIYHPAAGTFTTNTSNELGNGMRFTLIETLSKQQLIVMELLEKNGQRLTPYDTPLVYDRK